HRSESEDTGRDRHELDEARAELALDVVDIGTGADDPAPRLEGGSIVELRNRRIAADARKEILDVAAPVPRPLDLQADMRDAVTVGDADALGPLEVGAVGMQQRHAIVVVDGEIAVGAVAHIAQRGYRVRLRLAFAEAPRLLLLVPGLHHPA